MQTRTGEHGQVSVNYNRRVCLARECAQLPKPNGDWIGNIHVDHYGEVMNKALGTNGRIFVQAPKGSDDVTEAELERWAKEHDYTDRLPDVKTLPSVSTLIEDGYVGLYRVPRRDFSV